jgi:hypothetical protein
MNRTGRWNQMFRTLNIAMVATAPHERSPFVCLPHRGVPVPMTFGVLISPSVRAPFSIVGDLSIADIPAWGPDNRTRTIQSP